jgi:hypothetical protein
MTKHLGDARLPGGDTPETPGRVGTGSYLPSFCTQRLLIQQQLPAGERAAISSVTAIDEVTAECATQVSNASRPIRAGRSITDIGERRPATRTKTESFRRLARASPSI